MEQGTTTSEYSSRPTDSIETTTLASDVENFDVLICFHDNSNLKKPVLRAKEILQEGGISTKTTIDATLTAGKPKLECIMQHARRSKYRVFVINKAFLKHDLEYHKPILFNANFSTMQNTVIMARPVHKKKIPQSIEHVNVKDLSNRIDGEEIAEEILKFISENKATAPPQSNDDSLVAVPAPMSADKCQEFDRKKQFFSEMVEGFSKKRAFVLCTCIRPTFPFVCNLSHISWIKVFDFDPDSEADGLLHVAKDTLTSGKFSITSACEQPSKCSDKITDWTIVKTESGNNPDFLNMHISSLSYFCAGQKPATMLIVWYRESDDDLEECLRDFVTSTNQGFMAPRKIKFVLCLADVPDERSELGKISKRYAGENRIIAPLEKICEWIPEIAATQIEEKKVKRLTLPKLKDEDSSSGTFRLQENEINNLLADMDVLALDDAEKSIVPNEEKVEHQGREYLKGGDITWDVIENGSYDVRRDIQQEIIDCLSFQYINFGQSGIVTLFHSPGSGGSTIGRRVLWELRKHVPCLALLSKAEIQDDFREKIKMVRDGSNLPIVLLIDGRSSQEVRNILDLCRYERIIILHILRHYSLPRFQLKTNGAGAFFLTDYVSKNEAPRFEKILIKYGIAGIKKKMAKLTKEVNENISHSVFEYGLTAFHAEFLGVKKYVESHLLLHHGLKPWHKVAAFLSLANYYGNCPVPSEFFSIILEKDNYSSVNLQDDIPELGQQFIRECDDSCDWKISHYIVAKEILDQYFKEANIGLDVLSIDFIKCARAHLVRPNVIPDYLQRILNNIFIIRYTKDANEDDDYKRKSKFSRLIMDVGDGKKQNSIFEKLTKEFPQNAEFCAHYGRFLGKSNQHDGAVKVLKEAVQIREDALQSSGKNVSVHGDEVLYRIHSMFGYAYNAHVRHMFGNKSVGYMIASEYTILSQKDLQNVKKAAECAIDQFKKCRSYYCPSVSPSYGFVGEIQIRLYLAEFCKKITDYKIEKLCDKRHPFHFLWEMICDSFVECDLLLDQCIRAMGDTKSVHKEVNRFFNFFYEYFIKSIRDFEKWIRHDGTISSKQYQLTLMKMRMKSDRGRGFRVFLDLPPFSPVVDKLLLELEEIFNHNDCKRINVSPYMKDWLQAIRLSKNVESYNFTRIAQYIKKWDENQGKESLSTLYHYIIHFISAMKSGKPFHFQNVNSLFHKLQERHRMLPQNQLERPVEWIKLGFQTISNCPLALLSHYEEKDYKKQIFNGNIVEAYIWRGHIELPSLNRTKLRVFFVPHKFGIKKFQARERCAVHFTIGFNPKHGAQAYDVAVITREECGHCNFKAEVSKLAPVCPRCTYPIVRS